MTESIAVPIAAAPLSRTEFEEAVTGVARPLRAVALRLARNQPDADDLIQEALFRAWRGVAGFRRGTQFKAWMARIVHNVFLNRVRKDKRSPQPVDPTSLVAEARTEEHPQLADMSDLSHVTEQVSDRVKRAVEALPESYRTPFVLCALGGHSYQEIAHTLSIPVGTVMSRIHRARLRLRVALAS